jgi:hypothetical protein
VLIARVVVDGGTSSEQNILQGEISKHKFRFRATENTARKQNRKLSTNNYILIGNDYHDNDQLCVVRDEEGKAKTWSRLVMSPWKAQDLVSRRDPGLA